MSEDQNDAVEQAGCTRRRRRKRRRKKRTPGKIKVAARFNAHITFKVNGVEQRAHPLEAGLLSQVAKAARGDMRAARRFLRSCEVCGLIEAPVFQDEHRYVRHIPKTWDHDEWIEMFKCYGPPPWKGERDGLVRDAEGNPVYD